MSQEKITLRATESGQTMEVVVLSKRADRIQVILGEGTHSVRCDLVPAGTGQVYVGHSMGREIVYERSRAQVEADIDRSNPALTQSSGR